MSVAPGDDVILATPSWVAAELVPDLEVPTEQGAIVNGHFRFDPPRGSPAMLGVVGGTVEWIFSFANRISITISGADRLLERSREELAETFWREIQIALGFEAPMPAWQVDQGEARDICRHARSETHDGQSRRRDGAICFLRATSPPANCPRQSNSRYDRASAPRNSSAPPSGVDPLISASQISLGRDRKLPTVTLEERRNFGSRRDRRAARAAAAGRALGFRARGRRDDPGRICAAAALSRRARRRGARSEDRRLSAPPPGRSMAAGRCSMAAPST